MLPPDLPPVSNKLTYSWRVLAKWISFFIFGLGSVIITLVILPPMRLFLHPGSQFKKYGRRVISYFLRFFVYIMHCLGMLNLELETTGSSGEKSQPAGREIYSRLSSKIVVANHPSLIDPLVLISLIPNSDTVAIPYRNNVILGGIIRQLFTLGTHKLDDVLQSCTESLKQGYCMIVFPEGTRTPRSSKVILKKGAARISLASGCNILPIHIGGTDKFGLGKKDPWTGFNPTDRYIYRLTMGTEINPEKYSHLPASAAAKIITDEIAAFLFPKGKKAP